MSVSKVNDYAVGDTNFTSFMETLDATRRGLAQVTISEYDTDSAPSVKVGSVFDNQGAFYQVTSADETPTGYSSISVSTTFYLYFDVSALSFIYSETAPTWSDLYQGWYNGDDRAFFSMYKDSTGLLYEDKYLLIKRNNYKFSNNVEISNELRVDTINENSSGEGVTIQAVSGENLRTIIVSTTQGAGTVTSFNVGYGGISVLKIRGVSLSLFGGTIQSYFFGSSNLTVATTAVQNTTLYATYTYVD